MLPFVCVFLNFFLQCCVILWASKQFLRKPKWLKATKKLKQFLRKKTLIMSNLVSLDTSLNSMISLSHMCSNTDNPCYFLNCIHLVNFNCKHTICARNSVCHILNWLILCIDIYLFIFFAASLHSRHISYRIFYV